MADTRVKKGSKNQTANELADELADKLKGFNITIHTGDVRTRADEQEIEAEAVKEHHKRQKRGFQGRVPKKK